MIALIAASVSILVRSKVPVITLLGPFRATLNVALIFRENNIIEASRYTRQLLECPNSHNHFDKIIPRGDRTCASEDYTII